MKKILDDLVKKYETKDFIKDDPIQFPHNYKKREDIEIAGFISALLAYGKREAFIQKLKILFSIMQNEPHNFILDFEKYNYLLNGFVYRFVKDCDLKGLLNGLSALYKKGGSLEELFSKGTQNVYDYLHKFGKNTQGFCHLLSNPENNSAQKRYNMFLRWMIRDGEVDLGIWNFKKKKDLLIPLDVHVSRISRQFNLLNRKSNDFKTCILLTEKLKEFDENDPVKYDFALFGLGVNEG